jgi:hypothetical protein
MFFPLTVAFSVLVFIFALDACPEDQYNPEVDDDFQPYRPLFLRNRRPGRYGIPDGKVYGPFAGALVVFS